MTDIAGPEPMTAILLQLAAMILASIAMDGPAGFYIDLKKSLIERFRIYTLSQENAEHLANKCLADWLQQCPLKFITAA